MIKIFSIEEVIEASNNILKRTKSKTKVNLVNKFSRNKNIAMKKVRPLILTDEISEENPLKKNLKEKKIIKTIKQQTFIDQLYLKFNKKIKKNTLKVIFELQKEVSSLIKIKDDLQKLNSQKEKKINHINTEFIKINNLNKNLKEEKIILNQKIIKLSKTIDYNQIEIENLKNIKHQFEKELDDKLVLKEQIAKLSENMKSSQDEIKILNNNKSELEKEINAYKTQEEVNKQKIYDISEVENKNKFFQEENLRIGSELLEVKKKHDILKKEIEKYENQKSNLISKINSVNEALSDTNILTNVFDNKVVNKVNVIDHNKIDKKNSSDLDEQIKNIFSDQS